MSRQQLLEMARRNRAHLEAGTVDQAPEVYRVPASDYWDPDRFQRELERVFRRLPLVLGFSAELAEPGSYRALTVADTPVLLTRSTDGAVRGFLNVCSHRGAVVVPEGAGRARRFACPYHAWTYDDRGRLASIYKREHFGDVDRDCLGLVPLPVIERAGLVFGVLRPGREVDFDAFLCGYDQLLEHLGLARAHLVGRQAVEGPNWKIAYDGYLDFYHLPILHRESFGPRMPSDALYDAWGPHQRVSMPNPRYRELDDGNEAGWEVADLVSGVWTIFPHVSIADFDAGGRLYMVSQLFPGPGPDRSLTVQNFLALEEPDAERREAIEATMAFLLRVVRDEDYATGLGIQKALETGARRHVLFGRNESGGQRFHRWLKAILDSDDDRLARLFADGID